MIDINKLLDILTALSLVIILLIMIGMMAKHAPALLAILTCALGYFWGRRLN